MKWQGISYGKGKYTFLIWPMPYFLLTLSLVHAPLPAVSLAHLQALCSQHLPGRPQGVAHLGLQVEECGGFLDGDAASPHAVVAGPCRQGVGQ